MKPVLIVENSTNSLIRENKTSNSQKSEYILSGVFTEFGVKNRNDRIYTAEKFLPALDELNERIKSLGVVYGEFDHPDVFDTSLSRASHIITEARYLPNKNTVNGQIKLLSTYWGKEAKSLVDDGLPVFVSSRAAGVTESDGSVSLKKLFTYDIVADPGFASAKMSVNVLNESLGYTSPSNSNFRIYEMSDESKINELFNMNKNDFVTKKQLTDYSRYLVNELASTKNKVNNAVKRGNLNPNKLNKLLEYYDELNVTNSKIVEYLDYLAEKLQIVVNENKSLKTSNKKIIAHNNYLAENLEKSIAYTEYLAENVDKNIAYSEYIAENVDKSIAYSEYLAENVDMTIAYSEYLAENVDNSIAYSEYLAEHVENNIAYSEYIAENLEDNIEYSEYIAENLDKSINYQGKIVEKLNGKKLYESYGQNDMLPSPDSEGFGDVYSDEDEDAPEYLRGYYSEEDDYAQDTVGYSSDEEDDYPQDTVGYSSDEEDDDYPHDTVGYNAYDDESCETCVDDEDSMLGESVSDSELSRSINKLILEAKKRKVSENNDLNFLRFLNKSQVDSFYNLSKNEQETVKLYINEKSYFTQKDVLLLINEALSSKTESLEERTIRLMPENIKPIWEKLNNSSKKSLISQARLYPEDVMKTEEQIAHFWNTRNIKKNESLTKKLISHDVLIQEDRISDSEAKAILERFRMI